MFDDSQPIGLNIQNVKNVRTKCIFMTHCTVTSQPKQRQINQQAELKKEYLEKKNYQTSLLPIIKHFIEEMPKAVLIGNGYKKPVL